MFHSFVIVCFLNTSFCLLFEDVKGPYATAQQCKENNELLRLNAAKFFKNYFIADEKCIVLKKDIMT